MNVLMVCLGNICRSPLADGLLNKKVKLAGLEIQVDSAGTSNYHQNEPPDARMRATAKSFGLSINDLKARQFNQNDFDKFDIIYVMDSSNYENVIALSRTEQDREKVQFILDELYPGQKMNVPDPYFGGEAGFIEVYKMLDEATDVILKKLS